MKEVSGPVVAIALILSAVFVPVALLGGLTGRIYQQFALTIAISVLLSAFSALSLSPALAAMILKAESGPPKGPLGAFFRWFNKLFDRTTTGYVNWTRLFVRRTVLALLVVAGSGVRAGVFAKVLPVGFVPDEDQGIFMINVQLPLGSSLQRTDKVLRQIEEILAKTEGVDACNAIGGLGMLTNSFSPEFGSFFCRLKPWDERKGAALHVKGIQRTVGAALARAADRGCVPLHAAHDLRVRCRGRLQLPVAGPQRHAHRGRSGPAGTGLPGRRAPAARAGEPVHVVQSHDAADLGDARSRKGAPARCADQRRVPGAVVLHGGVVRQRFQPVRPSVQSVRPGGAGVPGEARKHRPALRAQQDHERHDPAVHDAPRHAVIRDRDYDSIQPVPLGGDHRRAGGGLQLPAGHGGTRSRCARSAAARDGLRLFRDVVPGKGGAARRAHLRPRHRVRVPVARGPVRELAVALGCAPGDSARRPGGVLRRLGAAVTTTTSTCRSA